MPSSRILQDFSDSFCVRPPGAHNGRANLGRPEGERLQRRIALGHCAPAEPVKPAMFVRRQEQPHAAAVGAGVELVEELEVGHAATNRRATFVATGFGDIDSNKSSRLLMRLSLPIHSAYTFSSRMPGASSVTTSVFSF